MVIFDPISCMWEGYIKNQFIGLFATKVDAYNYIKRHSFKLIRDNNDTEIT